MIGTIWRAIRHMGHNDIGVMNPSGNGGRSSGDGQDGGSRVGSERAGEAEWSKGREGKTEQEDVQGSVNKESSAHRHNGGGRFFCLWYNGAEAC